MRYDDATEAERAEVVRLTTEEVKALYDSLSDDQTLGNLPKQLDRPGANLQPLTFVPGLRFMLSNVRKDGVEAA